MSQLNHDTELIQKYLLKELSSEESASVEDRLKRDSEFKAEVEKAFVLHQMVIEKRLFEVNDLLTDITKSKPKSGKGPIIGGLTVLALLLGGFGYFILNQDQTSSNVASNEVVEVETVPSGSANNNNGEPASIQVIEDNPSARENIPAKVSKHGPEQQHKVILTQVDTDSIIVQDEQPKDVEEPPKEAKQEERIASPRLEPVVDVQDPCLNKSWFLEIDKSKSCMGSPTGEIQISSSLSDLSFAIDDSDLSSMHEWEELEAGKYDLHIVDEGGCDTSLNVTIVAEPCRISGPDYEYYLGMDEHLEFRELGGQSGEVVVLDQRGQTLVRLPFSDAYQVRWDIKNDMTSELEVGFLSYIISFERGDMVSGGVTVLP